MHTEVLVIGGGPGGYPAALMAADHGKQVTLVDADPKLGGVCLNRGCIPSKALLHVAKLIHEVEEAKAYGLTFGEPKFDIDQMRSFVQQKVVGKMTGGVSALCKGRGVKTINAKAVFVDEHTVQLEGDSNEKITFDNAVIAVGSVPTMPKAFAIGDPRVMDSTGALQLQDVPGRMLVIGGGYIGLEMGSVYAALGTKVVVVEFLDRLVAAADEDLVKPLEKRLRSQFEAIYLNTKVASLKADKSGIVATLEGTDVPGEEKFDRVLVAVGRRPNSAGVGLDKAGVELDEKGFVKVDAQRRTNRRHIFAIGDVAGEPQLAHKATHEAKVVTEAILGESAEFDPRAIPAVIFTDPEIAWCGLNEVEAKQKKIAYEVKKFPWSASGRATTLARNEGLTKLIVEPKTQRLLGMGIVGVGAGEMISEGVLAVEMGAVARDVADSIHPHPTLSETVMESAELALGAAVHLAPPKKK